MIRTFTLLLIASTVAAAEKPFNLISIVTDDQGQWALGCYGSKEAITPNMDRLAREGALFRNAFTATPVCSPSRVAFLTGRYGTQMGITDFINPDEAKAGVGLPERTTTWPGVLRKAGYTTAMIGKWHLGTSPHQHPTRNGFDHFFGSLQGSFAPVDPMLEVKGQDRKLVGPGSDLITDEAIAFVTANADRPFALLLHFREPHTPYGPMPAADTAPFATLDPAVPNWPGLDAKQIKTWRRAYYAAIHAVDRNLGRLFAVLEERKLLDRTIVQFTSDHGYNIGEHGIHTKGNGMWVAGGVTGPKRPNLFDTSLRIPLLVRWPGTVKPGTVVEEPVSNIDTFASMLGMLGIAPPGDWKHEGADYSRLLRGDRSGWRDTLFFQYDLHNGGLAYMRGIRTSDWKLVRHYRSNGLDELYDLKADPEERKNLYGTATHRATRDRLQERLTGWMKSIDDPLTR